MEIIATWQTLTLLIMGGMLCSVWKTGESRSWRNFSVCFILIVGACIHATYMVDLSNLFDLLAKNGKITEEAADKAKAIASIWAGVASLVVGGVGVNLLSSWIDS